MKKLLLIVFLLIGFNAFSQSYTQTDTVTTTLATVGFTRVSLGSGVKTLHIHNTSALTLLIGLSNNADKADTTNIYKVLAGNKVHFYNRTAKYMYLYNGGTDIIITTISYGSGDDYYIDPINSSGVLTTTSTVTGTVITLDTTKFTVINKSNRDTVASSPDTLSRLPGNFAITAVRDTGDNVYELGITKWYQLIVSSSDTIVISSSVTSIS